MNKNVPVVSELSQTHPVTLLTFEAIKDFDQVIADFEKQLGKLDQDTALSSSNLSKSVSGMEGATGLMIIAVLEMDRLLPSLTESGVKARQYLVGNPLIASKMAQVNTLAALYAPPRVLIYTQDGKTLISYDQPSTVFGRLESLDIFQTANELDRKFENLARQSLA